MDDFMRELHRRLFLRSPISVDCSAYSEHLDWMAKVVEHLADDPVSHRDVFRNLVALRKDRTLKPKGTRPAASKSSFTEDDCNLIRELYKKQSLVTDDLPYTDEFETMFAEFHRNSKTTATRALFFCAILNLRKQGRLGRKHDGTSMEGGAA